MGNIVERKTPITLITGSLGSGKTTLLKRILNTTGRRIAVVMNEFGEIAIDSKIIQGENVQMIELAGGCVCCSMTGEFEAAVREIIDKAKPDFIVVEATGVAEADALAFEVEDNLPQVRLDSVICIVDAYLTVRHPYVGYTSRSQLGAADIVLINKVDLVSPKEAREVEDKIREYNDTAIFFTTVECDVNPELLLGLDIERRLPPATRLAEPKFESFTYTSGALLNEERFKELAANLPRSVFRAKGFVRFEEGSYLFNYVIGRPDLEPFESDRVQLVFIGPALSKERDGILAQLRECEV